MRPVVAGVAILALLAASAARADGGPRATALAVAGGAVWTTVPGGVVAIDPETAELRRPTRALATRAGNVLRLAGRGDTLWGLRPWTLLELDVARAVPARTIPVPGPSFALAGDGGLVWVADDERGRLAAVDAEGEIARAVAGLPRGTTAIADDGRSVWVASIGRSRSRPGGALVPLGRGTVTRVDAGSGEVLARIPVGRGPGAIAVGAGAVWVASFRGVRSENSVTRVDPAGNRSVASIRLPARPTAIAVHGGTVWVVGYRDRARLATITRIDPATNAVVTRPLRAAYPAAIVGHAGALWVADEGAGSVLRVDPQTGRPVAAVSVRGVRAPSVPAAVQLAGDDSEPAARVPLLGVLVGVLALLAAAGVLAHAWAGRRPPRRGERSAT